MIKIIEINKVLIQVLRSLIFCLEGSQYMTRHYGIVYDGKEKGRRSCEIWLWDLEHCGKDGIQWAGGGIAEQIFIFCVMCFAMQMIILWKESAALVTQLHHE